jgi:hypothetical protein
MITLREQHRLSVFGKMSLRRIFRPKINENGKRRLFYFPSSFFPVHTFHVVNSLLSHSSCYFLHPRILLLPGGHHSKLFRRRFSSLILCTCPYQFNNYNLMKSKTEFFIFICSLIVFIFFIILTISPISSKSQFP